MSEYDWFQQVVADRLGYLVAEFGFRESLEDDLAAHSLANASPTFGAGPILTVTYLGPVAVRATWEQHEGYVGLAVYLLDRGAFPMVAPVTNLSIEWIVRARAPGEWDKYVEIHKRHPPPIEEYLTHAAGDLRSFASDLLRGDTRLVEEVRADIRGALPGRGVLGVDWWADETPQRSASNDIPAH